MRKLLKNSYLIIILSVAVTVFFALRLRGIEIQNTIRMFMPQKGESYTRMLNTEEQFGSMLLIGISIEAENDPSVITPQNIQIIRNITEKCSLVDYVTDIDSLTNVDFIYGEDGALVTEKLVGKDDPVTDAQIARIKQSIADWQDMYQNVILSNDGKITQIIIKADPDANSSQQIAMLSQIKAIVSEQVKGTDLTVRYYGEPVQSDEIRKLMMVDLTRLIPLVILVVILTLYFSFRSFAGTMLPLLTVLMSTVWACGLMAIFGVTFTLIASVIPIALIACGSAYGIHVISHYYEEISAVSGEITKEKHLNAIISGLKSVRMPIFLAGITTIAGFISLVTSPLIPLQSFAVFTALGVGFALLLSVTLIPAMLYITPLKHVSKRSGHMKNIAEKSVKYKNRMSHASGDSTMFSFYKFFAGTRPRVTLLILLILIASGVGIHKMVIDTAMINYFPKEVQFRKNIDFVDKNLTGSNTLFFVVSGREKGDMTKPEILKAVDNMQNHLLKTMPEIGKIVSFTTFIKRMNQVMHVPFVQEFPVEDGAAKASVAENLSYDGADFGFDFGDGNAAGTDSSANSNAGSSAGTGAGSPEKSVDNSSAGGAASSFVDPNPEYAKRLDAQLTAREFFDIIQKACAEAGGDKASVADLVRKIEQALNYNGTDYYEIPYDEKRYPVERREQLADLVSQYLLLYSGSLDNFADDQLSPKVIRIQVQIREQSTQETKKIIEGAKSYAAKYFPEGYTIEATGNAEMQYNMAKMVINSQMTSIIFSIILVFIILSVSFKSPMAGFIGAIPLVFTILLNFMVMGFADIHLDLLTSIIASVAIGIGIDYTIHFMETYRAERAKTDNLEEVTRNTFRISGQGIMTNALAVGLGFAVLILSNFIILRYVGILVTIVMFSSSTLALTIIPGFLNLLDPKFMHSKAKDE
ncbi:RND family transporter [Treponema parvum]|uniref:RND family transporter n=1 Tax=Treponema parvum TaxID=138851 RepID=A0A975F056_9SPIR|nr:MMPL family transporter [Treponema parvum]QTQ12002.1 RND family transporter [Treponema parvum]